MKKINQTILLVEDELITALAQTNALTNAGFRVISVHSGEKAIEIVRSGENIDLILMDIELGAGMDGIHASQQILKDYYIPILFLSSHTEKNIIDKIEGHSCYGYVVKNTGIAVLTASINMSLKLHQAYKELQEKDALLRESEQRYRLLIETANEGILVAQGFNLKFANPMMLELTGYNEKELMSLPFLEFAHHDDRELVKNNHIKCSNGEVVDSRYHFRIIKNDKSIKWVEMSCVKIEWENKPATLNFITDITERKHAEDALVFNNIILHTQQESSVEGILVVDENGKILSFNQRFVRMWGISNEIMESKSDELALQSMMDKLTNPDEFLLKVKSLYNIREERSRDEIVLKDGRKFDRYSAPMNGTDGKYYGRVWYFKNITDLKKTKGVTESKNK